MVVVEALKARSNRGRDANLYFFLDSDGTAVIDEKEVDSGGGRFRRFLARGLSG